MPEGALATQEFADEPTLVEVAQIEAASSEVATAEAVSSGSTPEDRAQQAIDLVVDTIEALADERGEDEKIWGSMVKQTLKRRRPGFNETYYGYRSFNTLLEEARDRGLIELERDEKSGGYTVRMGSGVAFSGRRRGRPPRPRAAATSGHRDQKDSSGRR